jgi:hypothetical protein
MKILRISPLAAGIVTFVFGFVAYSIPSIFDGTFFPTSSVAFPVTKIFTILIGDSIFLPILIGICVRFLCLLRENLDAVKSEAFAHNKLIDWLLSKRTTLFGIGAAVLGNSFLHYVWIHDNYTGFMDTSFGKLTIAGWIHLVFSFFATSLVIVFVINGIVVSLILLKSQRKIPTLLQAPSIFLKGLLILFVFQSIQFFDLVYRTKYIFPNFGVNQEVLSVIFTDPQVYLSIIPLLLILLLTFVAKEGQKMKLNV